MTLGRFYFHNKWWFWIHNSNEIPSGYDLNAIPLENGFRSIVEFTVISYHLLKSPYSTNCQNYIETEYLSQKDCIRKCKIKRSVAECGVVSHEINVFLDEPKVIFAETQNQTKCVKDLNLKKRCLKICPKYDCFKQQFIPKVVSKTEYKSNETQTTLSLSFSGDPQVTHYHKPKLETVELLCYLASILSLWFGFSMISTFDWLKIILTKANQSIKIRIINIKNDNNNRIFIWQNKK